MPAANKNTNSEALNLGVLSDLIGYQIRRAQLKLYHSFSVHLGSQVTPAQLALLVMIKHNAGISQSALAKANDIERSTLGEIVDRFVKRGLVRRRRHPSDRRIYALYLSEQGQNFLDTMEQAVLQQEEKVLQDWSEQEKQTLMRLLLKLNQL